MITIQPIMFKLRFVKNFQYKVNKSVNWYSVDGTYDNSQFNLKVPAWTWLL